MLEVSKKHLASALGHLKELTKGSVLLRSDDTSLTLSHAGDISAVITVPASPSLAASPIHRAVPAALLDQLVRNAPHEFVSLYLAGTELSVSSGQSTVRLQTSDPDALPTLKLPPAPAGQRFTIPSHELTAGLDAVLYAASTENFQAVFRGALLEGNSERLRLVTSDGYRVAIADLPHPTGEQNVKTVIHAAHLRSLMRMLKDHAGDLAVQVTLTETIIRTDGLLVRMTALDGDFPDYQRVIPTSTSSTVTLPAARLLDSVNRVAILADRNANNRTELLCGKDNLTITAEGDYGRAKDTLDAALAGDPVQLTVNARMLMDALSKARGEAVIAIHSPLKPILITSELAGVTHVLVTLRV